MTATHWSRVCLPRLYNTIIVDTSYSEFSKEYDRCPTYINLLYSFKKLLRQYSGRWPIVSFLVVHLPDSTNVYDMDVNSCLLDFFTKAHRLQSLIWLSDNFKLDFLKCLPDRSCVTELALNIKFSNYLGELSLRSLLFNFNRLSCLRISPFHNKHRLLKVLDTIMSDDPVQIQSSLTSLRLARFDAEPTPVTLLAKDLHDLTALRHQLRTPLPPLARDIETDTLETIFTASRLRRIPAPLQLTELGLDDFLLGKDDAVMLLHSLNLHSLKRLQLRNISEVSPTFDEGTFLCTIAPAMSQLEQLHLDIKETRGDSTGSFVAQLENVTELDWVIRCNDIKWRHVDRDATFAAYADALRNKKLLKKLLIEVRDENPFCEAVVSTPLAIVDAIAVLSQLESIRLNSGDTTLAVEEIFDMLTRLKTLTYLDVYGAKAGGAPHLGLGTVHPNVYDEWFKVQHVALLYKQSQPNLSYARINNCVFEYVADGVEPRDEIDRWFDSKVCVE